MTTLRDVLPALYRDLLPTLDVAAPTESKATCSSCAMCGESDVSVDGKSRMFNPDTKCCTYHPKLPNYLVGAILADKNLAMAEGRKRVREKLARGIGVTPQWLRAPAKYNVFYDHARGAFGRSSSLLCPYFAAEVNGGGCSIWAYREAVCSTYFCKHVGGADGRAMWMSLKRYLAQVEHALSRYALMQAFPEHLLDEHDGPPTGTLTAEELEDRPPTEAAYGTMWGAWKGREEQLYRTCFESVSALTAADVERLLGIDGTVAAAVLEKKRAAAIDPRLPERLALNMSATVKWLADGTFAVAAYSEHEALVLPREAYPLLVAFNGSESVHDVRARLRREHSADLDEDVLLALYQQRVLT